MSQIKALDPEHPNENGNECKPNGLHSNLFLIVLTMLRMGKARNDFHGYTHLGQNSSSRVLRKMNFVSETLKLRI